MCLSASGAEEWDDRSIDRGKAPIHVNSSSFKGDFYRLMLLLPHTYGYGMPFGASEAGSSFRQVLESSLACDDLVCNCSTSRYFDFTWDGHRLVFTDELGTKRSIGLLDLAENQQPKGLQRLFEGGLRRS